MSVPETESGEAAGGPAVAAAAARDKADQWSDPRLPWAGKPRAVDIICWLGIVLSGVYYWALLPLRVSLVGTHPVVAELMNGGTESIISAAAFARTGHGTLVVVLLAAIPGSTPCTGGRGGYGASASSWPCRAAGAPPGTWRASSRPAAGLPGQPS